MLNYLWAFMMLVGILWGAFHGTMAQVTQGALDAAGDAVSLCITMLGVMSLWTGVLEVGQRAGLIEQLAKRMSPILRFLFPNLPKDHPANLSIATNMIANILGLGWAATPAGLKAMEELTFLILNISSLQLIPVNMIAYRQQYGSVNPAGIIAPAIVATFISTAVAVVYCKMRGRKRRV